MKPYENNGLMLEGPVEFAVIEAGAEMVRQDTEYVDPAAYIQQVNALEAALDERLTIMAEFSPETSRRDARIPITTEAMTALQVVSMCARHHTNPVIKAAAEAMEKDFLDSGGDPDLRNNSL